ncbi:hypothetical protein N665_0451s0012 [Sinapis alba]|nr:hypothetical protein N665_0451s0012 [Sinapis alba]
MDFEDNTNNEEEDDTICDSPPPLPLPSHILMSSSTGTTTSTGGGGFMVVHGGSRFRFRECLKNQAVNIGGHAVDGCGEFMPAGTEETIDALKCAACGCHRNFHRKELPYYHHLSSPPPPPGVYSAPAPVSYRPPTSQASPLQLALPPRERSEDRMESSSAEAGGGIRKRFRTKFTAEQKERMLGLAERIGWRIQRQDDEVIQRFCQETGVPRQVLKVWLHNNKNTRGILSSSPLDQHQNPTLPPPQSSSYHHEQEQP